MQDPFYSQPPQYQPDQAQSVTPPPPPSGQPYPSAPSYPPQSAPSYPPQSAYPQSAYPPPYTNYPPQSAYPPPQAYPTPQQSYEAATRPPQQPQQPRKQQPLLWVIIGVLLAIIVVGGVAFAAVSRGNSNPTATPTAQANSNSTPGSQATSAATQGSQPGTVPTNSPTGNHKIGDTVSIDGWIVKVNGAKVSHGGTYDQPQKAGDVYLEIDVSVTNQTGKAQQFLSDLSFVLKDSTGQQYNQTFVSDGSPQAPNGTIQNGSVLRGTMPFEVSPDLKTFELDFQPDSFSSTDSVAWTITVS